MKKLFVITFIAGSLWFSSSPAQAGIVINLTPVLQVANNLLIGNPGAPGTNQVPAPVPAPPVPQVAALPDVYSLPVQDLGQTVDAVLIGQPRQVRSTAYCLRGQMASGKPVYEGAAAMNGVPLGAKFKVLDGPRAGDVFTVEDRVGRGSAFDIAYPGRCRHARLYGRRFIWIHRMGVLEGSLPPPSSLPVPAAASPLSPQVASPLPAPPTATP